MFLCCVSSFELISIKFKFFQIFKVTQKFGQLSPCGSNSKIEKERISRILSYIIHMLVLLCRKCDCLIMWGLLFVFAIGSHSSSLLVKAFCYFIIEKSHEWLLLFNNYTPDLSSCPFFNFFSPSPQGVGR